jgi:hypothetical protein
MNPSEYNEQRTLPSAVHGYEPPQRSTCCKQRLPVLLILTLHRQAREASGGKPGNRQRMRGCLFVSVDRVVRDLCIYTVKMTFMGEH